MQTENNSNVYNPIEMQELLEDVNEVIKSGVNKIVYDILFKKLNDELNKCKAELVQLKKAYGTTDVKENIELKIEDDSENATKALLKTTIKSEPKYSEILKVSEKIQNAQINKTKPKLVIIDDNNGETEDSQLLECENCDVQINSSKEGYQVLSKGSEDKVVCTECFTDLKEDFLNDGWVCDDSSEEEEEEEVEESEAPESNEGGFEEEVEEVEESEAPESNEGGFEEESEAPESNEGGFEEESEAPESNEGGFEEESEAPESNEGGFEEEEEVFEIEIDDVSYFATNEENGPLYEVDEEGNPGNQIGYLKDGEPFFY